MENWTEETKLINGTVVRATKLDPATHFYVPNTPPELMFLLSTKDKEQGQARGKQPLLSAWDISVPVSYIIEVLKIEKPNFPGIYALDVGDINEISTPPERTPIEVHKDFLPPDDSSPLETEYLTKHFGIQGLYRRESDNSAATKAYFKTLRLQLASIAKPVLL